MSLPAAMLIRGRPTGTRRLRRASVAAAMCLVLLGAVLPVVIGVEPASAVADEPALTLQTSGGIVRDGSVVESGTVMTAAVGGLLEPGNGSRELRIDLDAATVYRAGGVTAPEGWTIEWSTDDGANWVTTEPGTPADVTSVRATATVEAGAANGSSQQYSKDVNAPVPASTFSGSTGGDGWDTFFYDDYVLNIFHHQETYVALDCHLRSTGARCTGYDPTQTSGAAHSRFSGYRAGNRSGGWVDGNTGFAYAFSADNTGGANQGKPGVLCLDLNTSPPGNCGFTPLSTNTNITGHSFLSNAEGVGGRLFGLEAANQQLLCYDPDTDAPCAGSPVSLSGGTTATYYHVYGLGTKVFASTNTTLYCFESSNLAPCAGSWPVTYASLGWTSVTMSPVAHMDTSGTIDGVCMWNGCLDLAGAAQTWVNPHSVTPWSANAAVNGSSGQYGKFEATAGRAYLHTVLQNPTSVYCFDYATEAACAGFDTTPTADWSLYALRADPNNPTCIWYNSDPGKIGLFDAVTGASECSANPVITLQPSAFAPRFVCTTSGGIDRWTSLTLDTVSGGTPASQTLTVRTGNGDPVTGWIDRPITVGQTLSLADLTVAQTGARPTFNISFSGVTGGALTSADFTILYEGRGPELCVDYTVDNTSAPGSPNCPVVQSIVGTLSQNVSGPVSATALSRSFTASGDATECPPNIIYAGPPGPVVSLASAPTAPNEATVTFLPPTDDGGSPIRWYELSTDGGSTWTVVPNSPGGGGLLTHVAGGYTPGSYTWDVRAVNLLGTGPTTQVAVEVSADPPTTTTTAPPTTTPAGPSTTVAPDPEVEPIPDSDGDIPDLDPGESEVLEDGEPIDADIDVVDDGTGIEVDTGDGVVLTVSGACGDGPCSVVRRSGGRPYLVIEDSGRVRASGEGFRPGSDVHVWLTEGPTYLGVITVSADGTFAGSFAVSVAPGEYTLQVNGITADGGERSTNLGLRVSAGTGLAPGELAYTGGSFGFAYLGLLLVVIGGAVLFLWRRNTPPELVVDPMTGTEPQGPPII